MRAFLNRFQNDQSGIAATEFGLLSVLLISVTIGALELGLGYFQYNSAQQAARIGARLAATSDPVASDMRSMTGLGGGTVSGDPMPAYSRTCKGASQRCNQGGYNAVAMNALLFGPDNDGVCEANANKLRRGVCDVLPRVSLDNLEVRYEGSGLGTAGNPAVLSPLVTVTVKDLDFNFFVIDAFMPNKFSKMPEITVSVMAEDLKTRS